MNLLKWTLVLALTSSFAFAENVELKNGGFTRLTPSQDGSIYTVDHCARTSVDAAANCTVIDTLSKERVERLKSHLLAAIAGREVLVGGGDVLVVGTALYYGVVAGVGKFCYATSAGEAWFSLIGIPLLSGLGAAKAYDYAVNNVLGERQTIADEKFIRKELKKALNSDGQQLIFPDSNTSSVLLPALLKP